MRLSRDRLGAVLVAAQLGLIGVLAVLATPLSCKDVRRPWPGCWPQPAQGSVIWR